MSLRVEQLFFKTADTDAVAEALVDYGRTVGKRCARRPKYRWEGVRQVLDVLVKKQRRFRVLADDTWTVVWETVADCDFADPDIAKRLSSDLETDSVWTSCNVDYNIWAYQHHRCGKLLKELFVPKCYFERGSVDGDLESYGYCVTEAERLGTKLKLPAFLLSTANLERNAKLKRKAKRIQIPVKA